MERWRGDISSSIQGFARNFTCGHSVVGEQHPGDSCAVAVDETDWREIRSVSTRAAREVYGASFGLDPVRGLEMHGEGCEAMDSR